MPRTRTLVISLLAAFALWLALPAFAQEGEEPVETPTTVAEEENVEGGTGYTPAVSIVPQEEAEATPPWTFRYLVPTGLVLAALAVFVTVVQYFLRVVRNRYKVVE